ncbi:uncharacterized protein LOC110433599 [Sorghum bicolor]|uniref:uncharacterized protein LOC110433599 n=1 Tax=Sorghum bicolor TaxID=4558 RepID=UPI000B425380|nr:uncharacterized protein LOC110433599 [Sorghum bicolor]|eukprot:XP_021311745.1 uncharacterized protein LOC110433599 [Sorghum bicolor]
MALLFTLSTARNGTGPLTLRINSGSWNTPSSQGKKRRTTRATEARRGNTRQRGATTERRGATTGRRPSPSSSFLPVLENLRMLRCDFGKQETTTRYSKYKTPLKASVP